MYAMKMFLERFIKKELITNIKGEKLHTWAVLYGIVELFQITIGGKIDGKGNLKDAHIHV